MTIPIIPRQIADGIVADVAERHGVAVEDIMRKCNFAEVREARWEVMSELALTFPSWSMSRIARFMGVHHTRVVVAFKHIGYPHDQFKWREARLVRKRELEDA